MLLFVAFPKAPESDIPGLVLTKSPDLLRSLPHLSAVAVPNRAGAAFWASLAGHGECYFAQVADAEEFSSVLAALKAADRPPAAAADRPRPMKKVAAVNITAPVAAKVLGGVTTIYVVHTTRGRITGNNNVKVVLVHGAKPHCALQKERQNEKGSIATLGEVARFR